MKKDKDNNTPKRRSTFAILFYINRTKVRKDGTCQLLCKVSIDAEWEQIGTKVSVNPDIWNPEKGRADGRSANAVTVNRAIDSLTVEINEHYEDIRRSLGFVTAELVKNAMKGIGRKPSTLLALFREHNEEFHKRVGVDRTKESYESYLNSYRHLSAFVTGKRNMEDVPLRALDRAFYDDFEVFLGADRGLKPKSVHEHLYRLKKMTMRAVSQVTLRRDPYARLHPPLPRRKSRHMRLDDLKLLMEKQIDAPNLQRVRDWFIFSTFTGLAYADLKQLSEDDISQAPDGTWFFNLYCRNHLIRLTRQLGEEYGFYLTFHKARHNFGTHITLSMGVPIETVSHMMGHKSITTTQIYAQVTDRKVDEDMKRLRMQATGSEITLIDESMDKAMEKRRKYNFRNKAGNGL